jgi:uncharacterized membrane protein YphA (DoxX/SURF4 family)
MYKKLKLARLLLRIGLIAVFLYATVSSFLSPGDWIGYLPHVATTFVPAAVLLKVFSIYELGLAVWLASGWHLRYAGGLSALTMLGIIVSGPTLLAITFRDVAIGTGAAALAVLAD